MPDVEIQIFMQHNSNKPMKMLFMYSKIGLPQSATSILIGFRQASTGIAHDLPLLVFWHRSGDPHGSTPLACRKHPKTPKSNNLRKLNHAPQKGNITKRIKGFERTQEK